jgi:cytidylate kinase
MTVPVITIDGPSGSGKGTVSAAVADRLGWHFLDSGALYRLLGLAANRHRVDLADEPGLAVLARELDVRFEFQHQGEESIWLDGEAVGQTIRTEEVAMAASRVAAIGLVRKALLARQRDFRQPPGLVADGRDMGTVVFPDAPCKIFLTASANVRAERRFKQLNSKGAGGNILALLGEIRARDERDANREFSPLRPADDAEVIDTTDMSIETVIQQVMRQVAKRIPG